MAEPSHINIRLGVLNTRQLLLIPESIRVPKGSLVIWDLETDGFSAQLIQAFFHVPSNLSVLIQIYFSDSSPFKWQTESTRIFGNPLNRSMKLAEGVAEEKGEYKYGVRVLSEHSSEPLFDDDPYLIVY